MDSSHMETEQAVNQDLEIDLNYSGEICRTMKHFYEQNFLCDITLISGNDQKIHAHRVILTAASQYFANLLKFDDQENVKNVISLPDIHGADLKAVINYCYSGVIDLNASNALSLLKASFDLKLIGLKSKCYNFLVDCVSPANCLEILNSAIQKDEFAELYAKAKHCVELNFDEMNEMPEFLHLKRTTMVDIMQSQTLNVYSEEDVFNAMIKWVNYNEAERSCEVLALLPEIRLIHIRSKFLYNVIGEFYQRYHCSSLIQEAYMWKCVPESQPNAVKPRLSTVCKRLIAFASDDSFKEIGPTIEVYCPLRQKWKFFSKFSLDKKSFCSIVVNDEVYMMGGSTRHNQSVQTVHRYNFTLNEFKETAPMNKARSSFAAVVMNDYIYAIGGSKSKSVERFDLNTQTWTLISCMSEVRAYHAASELNGRIFAIGGSNKDHSRLDTVEYYDQFTKRWKHATKMNRKRRCHSVFVRKDFIYVVGGYEEGSTEFYDSTINKWIMIDNITIPRYGFGLISNEDSIIIAGGNTMEHSTLSSMIKIDALTNKCESLSSMSYPRYNFGFMEVPCYIPNI